MRWGVFDLGVHLQGFGITLLGQLANDVRQVAVSRCIAGMGLKGFFEVVAGFFESPFGGVKNAEVVVSL